MRYQNDLDSYSRYRRDAIDVLTSKPGYNYCFGEALHALQPVHECFRQHSLVIIPALVAAPSVIGAESFMRKCGPRNEMLFQARKRL